MFSWFMDSVRAHAPEPLTYEQEREIIEQLNAPISGISRDTGRRAEEEADSFAAFEQFAGG